MKYLFGSEIDTLAFHFRDYIRYKYQVELHLEQIENETGKLIGVFITENAPHLTEIEQEKNQFLQHPFDQKYQQSSWSNGNTINTTLWQTFCQWKPRFSFQQLTQHGNFTLFITALCIILHLAQWFGYQEILFSWTHFPIDEQNQFWRYISHSLVHLSFFHILFNLTWWWIFAGIIEHHFGSLRLIALFILSALISGISQNIASGPYFFGLSGVVYAVLGFAFIQDKIYSRSPFQLPKGFSLMLIIGIATGFISPFFGIQMGNTAHISGLIVGGLFGLRVKSSRI